MADPIFVPAQAQTQRFLRGPKIWGAAVLMALSLGGLASAATAQEQLGQASLEQSPARPEGTGAEPRVLKGTVTKISDGDTIHFLPEGSHLSAGSVLKIRMMTEDTPELHLPGQGGMHSQGWWAVKATEVLGEMIPVGTQVKLFDYGKDVYGRTLGRIQKMDGFDVNRAMVESGWGVLYLICSGPTCNADFFEKEDVEGSVAACEKAVSEKRGVFDPADPLPELPFEYRLRIQGRQADKWIGNLATHELFEPTDYAQVPICQRLFFKSRAEAIALGFLPASAPASPR